MHNGYILNGVNKFSIYQKKHIDMLSFQRERIDRLCYESIDVMNLLQSWKPWRYSSLFLLIQRSLISFGSSLTKVHLQNLNSFWWYYLLITDMLFCWLNKYLWFILSLSTHPYIVHCTEWRLHNTGMNHYKCHKCVFNK